MPEISAVRLLLGQLLSLNFHPTLLPIPPARVQEDHLGRSRQGNPPPPAGVPDSEVLSLGVLSLGVP